jgi:hypothetical protein
MQAGGTKIGFLLMALTMTTWSAESDALSISAGIRSRHLPHGTILDPMYEAPGSTVLSGYTRCGDSAIWTGHWLAAESYRWAVTRSPEALENIRLAIDGIRKLIDVTGTDLLSRCALPADSPYLSGIAQEEAHHGVYSGVVDGQRWAWIGNTSRDQYCGVFFGLTAAYNLVDVAEVKGSVNSLATRMLGQLLEDSWLVRMPDGQISTTFIGRPDQQLALLKLGSRTNPSAFLFRYRLFSFASSWETGIPIAFEVLDQHGSYFKFNLDHINSYGLLTSGDSGWNRDNYSSAFHILRRGTGDHGNAFFNMVEHAIEGPDAGRDGETLRMLDAWLKRPRFDPWVDLRGKYPGCGEDRACEPIPVEERVRTDFLWQRSPFLLYGGGEGRIETAAIDYILPYWMARYHKITGN